jgi:hypothetical protein
VFSGAALDHRMTESFALETAWYGLSITPRKPGTVETRAAATAHFDLDLVAHRRNGAPIRADEHHLRCCQCLRDRLALEKP